MIVIPDLKGVTQIGTFAGMSQRWKVLVKQPEGVELVQYGPSGDTLPAKFTAAVEYVEHPLQALITASFDGAERVKVESVMVERTDAASVAPEDMTRLQLAQVMGSVVWEASNSGRGALYQGGRRHAGPPDDQELLTLARMYWFEYVSWGKPRQAVMSAFEVSRMTANRWIRQARDRYGLPGRHAGNDKDVV